MAGPNLDFIVGLAHNSKELEVSWKIMQAAVSRKLGLIFGKLLINRLYEAEGQMLEELTRDVTNPLVFTVTSNPMATDAMEIFEEQLNPLAGADPANAELLRFLDDLWSIDGVNEMTSIIWDSMSPSAQHMPRYKMHKGEFRAWLANYYKTERSDSPYGGQGIFHIKKS